jgi:amidase
MAKLRDLAFLDATAQAELIRRKEVRPIELVEEVIESIERLNPMLNAVVTPMYDHARAAATGELPDGPFAGVPFLLKDMLAFYKDVRSTSGAVLLQDYSPDHDSELVVRLKRAGLIHSERPTCQHSVFFRPPNLISSDPATTLGILNGHQKAPVEARLWQWPPV